LKDKKNEDLDAAVKAAKELRKGSKNEQLVKKIEEFKAQRDQLTAKERNCKRPLNCKRAMKETPGHIAN